jgi:outer membrane protein TolC
MANPNQRRIPPTQYFHSSWQIGVQLSYAPNDTATGLSQTAAARARADAADAKRRQLLDAVRSEVVEAVIAHRDATASHATATRRLASAETSYRARRQLFENDRATTLELTEAQTELFRARLDVVQASVAVRVANARLAYATGTP